LLVAAKGRLNAQLRTTDTLARIGGDEFAVLLEGIHDMGAANATIKRIFDAFIDPITVGPHTFKTAASAGIALYPKDDTDPAGLLSQAELAMYQAKGQGRHTLCYFDRDADIRRRMNLESELQQAIERGQLWLAYQPQVDLGSGRVVGAEALIRWTHPARGLVSPAEFIPLAESSDLILSIGEWIIREICRQSEEWRAAGLPKLQLGFNVSGVQFRRADLHGQVTAMLSERGLGPDAIDIEVTESVAMERSAKVQENFGRLTEAGISISMDDFGTGYSSLSNLSAFPVTRLKVDGSFVSGIGRARDAEKIVEAVVGLGRSLDLRVVAEGVETVAQARFLKNLQCDEIQGYLVSKPLPPEAFRRFIAGFAGLPV
jgi:predicted signal transduction protein with EAL and GGDEF domain